MFGHFKEELVTLRGMLAVSFATIDLVCVRALTPPPAKVSVLRQLVAKNATAAPRVEKILQRVAAIEARFPSHAFGEDRDKEKEKKEEKKERK